MHGWKREWMDELMTQPNQTSQGDKALRARGIKYVQVLQQPVLPLPACEEGRERERRAISEMGFGFLSFPLIPSRARTTREETTHQIKSCEKW